MVSRPLSAPRSSPPDRSIDRPDAISADTNSCRRRGTRNKYVGIRAGNGRGKDPASRLDEWARYRWRGEGGITVPSTCAVGNSAWLAPVDGAARVYTVRWPLKRRTPPLSGRHSRKHAYHLYIRYVPPTKNISLCHTILATLKLERRGASESKSESPTNWTTFFHELITIPSPSFFSLPPLLSLSFPLPFLFLSFDGRVRVRVSSIVYKIGGSRFCRSGNAALLEPCSSLVRSLL